MNDFLAKIMDTAFVVSSQTKNYWRKMMILNKKFVALILGLAIFAMPISALDQPFMKAAKNDLQKSKSELNKATADKGGHRNKALSLVNQALAEVNAGITYDRIDPRNKRRNDSGEASEIFDEMSTASTDQPHMQRAKDHLQNALDNLQKATPDKGGYRQKAIDLVKEAIEQCNKGIAFDRNN